MTQETSQAEATPRLLTHEHLKHPDRVLAILIATGLFSGLSPWAPGTAGSIVGLSIFWHLQTLPLWGLLLLLALLTAAGTWATLRISEWTQSHDASFVVIDEVVGMGIAALPAIGHSADSWLVAFLLFRLFDVVKLGPIRWIDRQSKTWTGWKGAFAVQADDLLAGLWAGACLIGLQRMEWLVR